MAETNIRTALLTFIANANFAEKLPYAVEGEGVALQIPTQNIINEPGAAYKTAKQTMLDLTDVIKELGFEGKIVVLHERRAAIGGIDKSNFLLTGGKEDLESLKNAAEKLLNKEPVMEKAVAQFRDPAYVPKGVGGDMVAAQAVPNTMQSRNTGIA